MSESNEPQREPSRKEIREALAWYADFIIRLVEEIEEEEEISKNETELDKPEKGIQT